MVGCGVLPLDEAYRAIDFDTITLLLGMMIVVANLRLSGFFRLASNFVVARAQHPARAARRDRAGDAAPSRPFSSMTRSAS